MSQDDACERALSPKMHRFAIAIVEGEGQAAAYRAAYDAMNMSDGAVSVEAARLMRNPRVQTRIGELRDCLQRILGYSRATLLRELDEVRDLARSRGDLKALLSVTMGKAKILGFLDNPARPRSDSERKGSALLGVFDPDSDAE